MTSSANVETVAPARRRTEGAEPMSITAAQATGVLPLLAAPAVLDPGVMGRLDALRDAAPGALSLPQLLQAHVWAPIVAVSAGVLMLLPGLVFAFPRAGTREAADWLLRGLAFAIVLLALVVPLVQGATGVIPMGRVFAALVMGVSLVVWGVMAGVRRRDDASRGVVLADRRLLLSLLLIPAAMVALVPGKFFWESFNGDGAHAFESARLLLRQPAPFWPPGSGPVGAFPGMTSFLFAVPSSWYLRLFGEIDVAARLPVLLHLGVLAAVVAAFIPPAARRVTHAPLVWVALLPYSVAMAYSATYNVYAADIALPATQDTLLMAFALGAMLAWERREWGWLAACTALSVVSLPNGLVLMGLLPLAAVMVERPRPWRASVALLAILAGCVVAITIAPSLLRLAGQPAPGGEYGIVGMLKYFAFLQVSDWERVLYVAIPSGLVPLVTAMRWRSLDPLARTMVLVAAAYFLFFYVQAYTALHHYVPSMLLLVAAHWRALGLLGPAAGVRWQQGTVAAGVVALLLAWPRDAALHRDGEQVGRAVVQRVGDYAESDPAVFRASNLLEELFAVDWSPRVPETYGGSPLVWIRYARQDGVIGPESNYVLQRDDAAAPPDRATPTRRGAGFALYVLNDSVWEADRARRPRTETGSRWLTVPRGVLFRTEDRGDASPVIDVVAWLERRGIDVEALMQRLGVSP